MNVEIAPGTAASGHFDPAGRRTLTTMPSDLPRNEPALPGEPILAVQGLAKAYRRGFLGRRGAPAVDDLSFDVQRGEIFALLGHNGAGKTTTIKMILGLAHPDRGTATIAGLDSRDPASRLSVGYLPESPSFHENLTASELLDFYGRLLGLDRGQRRRETERCLERVGMSEFAGRRLSQCSKGMRQRVGLAQALLGDPRLLILDEPQSGLDPVGRRLVRDLLLDLKQDGRTVVFSSHIVPDVAAVADRVATLSHGRLADLRDLRQRPAAAGFRVVTARAADEAVRTALLHDAAFTTVQQDDHRWTLKTTSASQLERLLGICNQAGLTVYDVSTATLDLEDTVLADLQTTTQPEVVSC